jgi:hypothetical protein
MTSEELYRAAYGDQDVAASEPVSAAPMGKLDNWVKVIVAIGPELTPDERIAVLEHAQALRDRRKYKGA